MKTSAESQKLAETPHLIAQFCQRTLPKAEWTHAAHLRVGLWYVLHFSPEEALSRLRSGIRLLNEAHGTPNTDRGGYHETITRFYVQWIGRFVRERGRSKPFDELAAELVAAAGDNKVPLRYYSSAVLFSAAARLRWVEPDLASLDPELRSAPGL